MSVEIGQELLEQYGLSGLSSIIAAAIVKAERSDPRVKKLLFKASIREICRIAIMAGIEPSDLCDAAMTILEFSNAEVIRLRNNIKMQKQTELKAQEEKIAAELEKT